MACHARLALRPRYIETERWLRGYATLCAQWSSGPYGVSCTSRFRVRDGRNQLRMLGRYLVAPLLMRNGRRRSRGQGTDHPTEHLRLGHRAATAPDEWSTTRKLSEWPGRSGDGGHSANLSGRPCRVHAPLAQRRHLRSQDARCAAGGTALPHSTVCQRQCRYAGRGRSFSF